MPGRLFAMIGVALIAAMQADDSWARAGRGFSHASHGGHFGHGMGTSRIFAPRRAFVGAPFAYFPPPYYPLDYYSSPPDYHYQGATPPVSYYAPPPPAPQYYAPPPPATYAPPSRSEASQAPIYVCKDANGATSITNRKAATLGKVCRVDDSS